MKLVRYYMELALLLFLSLVQAWVYYQGHDDWLQLVSGLFPLALVVSSLLYALRRSDKWNWILFVVICSFAPIDLAMAFQEMPASAFYLLLAAGNVLLAFAMRSSESPLLEIRLIKKYPLPSVLPLAGVLIFFLKVREGLGFHELPVLLFFLSGGLLYVFALNRWSRVPAKVFLTSLAGVLLWLGGNMLFIWHCQIASLNYAFWFIFPSLIFARWFFWASWKQSIN